MKIKQKNVPYEQALKIPQYKHEKPRKQWAFLRWVIRVYTFFSLRKVQFEYREIGMEKLKVEEPCLILMNHSSFIDLEIIGRIFRKRPYHVVCTLDAMTGILYPLLRLLGCITTKKFITDTVLVRDLVYTVKNLKESIIMYPEASYSFDGTVTTLPDSLPKLLKMLNVPVVMVRAYGAFSRDPLYNGLQNRKVKVTADVEYILSAEDVKKKSVAELKAVIDEQFGYDHFKWQQENQVRIPEPFRADYLNRVLYKCPHCETEGRMEGKGIHIECKQCGIKYELTEYGRLKAVNGETKFDHVPDWYRWERECVHKELLEGTYLLDEDVDIYMLIDTKCIYKVGEGHLRHTKDGFHLTGCNGKLDYRQEPEVSYSLYSDFLWYEIGDVVCIGDHTQQYYCFPKKTGDVVAKTRLAAEELYKIKKLYK